MSNKKKSKLSQYPLVKFDFENTPKEDHRYYMHFKGKHLVLLGEIEQMPGHCILVETQTGKVHVAWHTDSFVKLTEEET